MALSAAKTALRPVAGAVGTVGGFYLTAMKIFKAVPQRPFQWRELITQAWFIASVSLVPTLLMSIPLCVMVVFQINVLLNEIGAIDLSGAGAGVAVIREIGPVVTVLVVAGAGATAICADLGSRTIREEIDAVQVLGIDPIQRLAVPRVIASCLVAIFLNGLVTAVGLAGGYIYAVFSKARHPVSSSPRSRSSPVCRTC